MTRRRLASALLLVALVVACRDEAAKERARPVAADASTTRTLTLAAEPSGPTGLDGRSIDALSKGGPLDPTAERLCAAVVTSVYARRAACCREPFVAEQGLPCMRSLSDALAEKSVVVEHADVVRCAAEMARTLQGCDWIAARLPEPPASCRALVKGRLDEGTACTSDLQCAEGLHCRRDPSAPRAPGICRGPSPVGEPCGLGVADLLASMARQLDAGLHHPECAGVCKSGRCAPAVAPGGPCTSGADCSIGHHCARGQCTKGQYAELGAPCTESLCGDGATCANGRCVALGGEGARCTSSAECKAACKIAPGASAGVCAMTCEGGLPDALSRPARTPPPEKAVGRFRPPAR